MNVKLHMKLELVTIMSSVVAVECMTEVRGAVASERILEAI